MTSPIEAQVRRGRGQLWGLIALFFVPLLIAFALYYGAGGWRPAGNTNKGELIHPPRPLPEFALSALDGSALSEQTLRGKWTLVYIGDGGCDSRCREALVLTRQTRLALNDDLPRVQRLFLATGDCCDLDYLSTQHPDLMAAAVGEAGGSDLLQVFPEGTAAATAGRIYIVDPLGNLMMSYAPEAPREALLDDLEKLLKLSHIG
jgi:cytochrome oxidase Cu insertion factor (SCO1/SenC/PrrC family)